MNTSRPSTLAEKIIKDGIKAQKSLKFISKYFDIDYVKLCNSLIALCNEKKGGETK